MNTQIMDESSVQHTSMLPDNNFTTNQNLIENDGKFKLPFIKRVASRPVKNDINALNDELTGSPA